MERHVTDCAARGQNMLVFVGTYTNRGSTGIYAGRFDATSGALTGIEPASAIPNPTFQVLHPEGRILYSVGEQRNSGGRHDSMVYAFTIEAGTGHLSPLNRKPAGGDGPCHLAVDQTGRFLFAANYASGSAAMFRIERDGRLGAMTDLVQHHGAGVMPDRQEGPHAHSVTLSPDNRFAFVADLGIDRLMAYRLDPERGRMIPHDPPWAATKPGAGPRHMAFHPNRCAAYLINELGNTLLVFSYNEATGKLEPKQEVSTLPEGDAAESFAADVHVAPSGRFVYGSNRGHDTIAVFSVDEKSGCLKTLAHEPVCGKWPRNFVIHPSGRFLLAANQESDSITVFRLDQRSGRLTPVGNPVPVPAPVCLTIIPA